ncbi:MAG: DoxX family protein [Candidatus Planktophila sp.]
MDILVIALAVVFVVSGLSKASGNAKGLSGTRDVNVPDPLARLVGVAETFAALGLLIGLKYNWLLWAPLMSLWAMMAGAIYFHFRADKAKTSFPAFFLLTLISIALVTI